MNVFCSFCRNKCDFKIVNEGIGHYEYWGAPGYDEKLAVVSTCCQERCLDENNIEVTPKEAQDLIDFYKSEGKGEL